MTVSFVQVMSAKLFCFIYVSCVALKVICGRPDETQDDVCFPSFYVHMFVPIEFGVINQVSMHDGIIYQASFIKTKYLRTKQSPITLIISFDCDQTLTILFL